MGKENYYCYFGFGSGDIRTPDSSLEYQDFGSLKVTMKTLLCMILILLLNIQSAVSQVVQCYTSFSLTNGSCSDLLGEVPLDDCCMNPKYGYEENGLCKSCRFASWTSWSSWSSCSVSCLQGVKQRRRACYGIGRCQDPQKKGSVQTEPCTDRTCCPENGGWTEWSSWKPCSVTCERGIKKRNRKCTNPPPICGGTCFGNSEETTHCDTEIVCPIHGGWSSWGSWGPCMGTCQREFYLPPEQERRRTCTNPSPSTEPPGDYCPGPDTDTQHCTGLPLCAVSGNWGSWSAPSKCSVTCGVGRQTQYRQCDNPAPKYGGQNCRGDNMKISLCSTDVNCPADGHWSEWSAWAACRSPNDRKITCKSRQGIRRRERDCLGRDHEGEFCQGEGVEHSTCYDIEDCDMDGLWSDWSKWSYCKPDCGENSIQTRMKKCLPDVSKYKETNLDMFSGTPIINCPPSDDTEETRPCFNLPDC